MATGGGNAHGSSASRGSMNLSKLKRIGSLSSGICLSSANVGGARHSDGQVGVSSAPSGFGRMRRQPGGYPTTMTMQQHEGDRLPRQHFFQQILGQMLVPVKSFASWLFPDVYWALTAYQGVQHAHQRAVAIAPQVLNSDQVQVALQEHAQQTGCGTDEATSRAKAIIKNMLADTQVPAVRFLGWVLSHVWARFYSSEVYVDLEGLERVRKLALDNTLVYVPTHKSHLDYLLLSYILFNQGIPVPHIAAGDNLNLSFIGQLLRNSGAFFIRRSIHGAPDAALYKAILARYVQVLVKSGHSMEFFIEGGRSRDGKVGHPRLGLLSLVVDATLEEKLSRGVALVPLSVSYDSAIELGSYISEQKGEAKVKESFFGFIQGTISAFRRTYGHVWVSFSPSINLCDSVEMIAREGRLDSGVQGEDACRGSINVGEAAEPSPMTMTDFDHLKPYSQLWRRQLVEVLGEEASHRIRRGTVITITSLLAAVLPRAGTSATPGCFKPNVALVPPSTPSAVVDGDGDPEQGVLLPARNRWMRMEDVVAWVSWLGGVLRRRGARVALAVSGAQVEGDVQMGVRLLQEMGCVEVSGPRGTIDNSKRLRICAGADVRLQLQYYANQALTWLAAEAVVVCACQHLAATGPTGHFESGNFWQSKQTPFSHSDTNATSQQHQEDHALGVVGQTHSNNTCTNSFALKPIGHFGGVCTFSEMVESPLSIACEDLEAAMVWLVQLLGMELTALLGPTVTTHAHIQAALNRLRGAGAVVSVKDGYLSVVSDSLAWKEATFAAAMMTPVLSTIGSCLGLVQQLLTVKSTRPNGKSCAKESDRILLLPPTCRARDVELMTASHVWLDDIVKDVIELGRVQSNDSAVEGSRFDMQHMQEQMLCSVQSVKSAMQSLQSIGLLVEAKSVANSPEHQHPVSRQPLPLELSKRSESSKELPSYDSVQSLHTLELLSQEVTVVQRISISTVGHTEGNCQSDTPDLLLSQPSSAFLDSNPSPAPNAGVKAKPGYVFSESIKMQGVEKSCVELRARVASYIV